MISRFECRAPIFAEHRCFVLLETGIYAKVFTIEIVYIHSEQLELEKQTTILAIVALWQNVIASYRHLSHPIRML